MGFDGIYALVMTNIAMENGLFIGDLPIQIVIFHSWVSRYNKVDLSLDLSICLSIHGSIHLSFHLSIYILYQTVSMYPSIHQSIHLSVHPSIYTRQV